MIALPEGYYNGNANYNNAGNVNGVRPDSFQLLLIRKEGLSIPLQVG